MFKLFDSHCHLQMPQFDADREEVLARMREHGVGAIVVGTDYEVSNAAVGLAAAHDFLWAAVGLHPNDNPSEAFNADAYEELAAHPKVVAIGECGLDYYRSGGSEKERAAQKERFVAHIELAQKLNKALIIHCRDPLRLAEGEASAHEDCISVLQKTAIAKTVPVVIHFFTGSGELAQKYLELGCYVSFPGPVTYTDMYDDSIRVTPLEKMLVETDSPFAAPMPHRGKRNEPLYVQDVIKKIASIKSVPAEEVTQHTCANAQKVFALPS